MRSLAVVVALLGCKSKQTEAPPPAPIVVDATVDALAPWPALATYPHVEALRTIAIPLAKPDHPRFDVGGPAIAGELALVASSQAGFVAVDYRRGAIAWTKPAGVHVAPPLVHGASIVLVGECAYAPQIPDGEHLLGCLRVVTPAGDDEAYLAIRGGRATLAFIAEKGPQHLWSVNETTVRWRRGEQAVTIDLLTGVARSASADEPPVTLAYMGKRWTFTQRDGRVIARGPKPWETEHPYTLIAGVAWIDGAPVLRIVNLGAWAGTPEVHVIDIDPTGSLRATVARPSPGIALLGHGVSQHGDVAIAVRADRSMERDFVAAYAANALLVYVYALPVRRRLDPVGIAVADDAVVVFHDGETLTVLPELLAPPTAPGASRGVSQNPTP